MDRRRAQAVTAGTLAVPIQTATYKGKLYGAPDNSNTELLWYRKDLVPTPPQTWDQMIAMADGPWPGRASPITSRSRASSTRA